MNNNNIGRKLLVFAILMIMILSSTGCSKKDSTDEKETKYLSPSYVIDMNNPEEVVGLSSNVFVGYVEKMKDTYYISDIPYTRYDVKVINNIKGELVLDKTIQVNKEGGISKDSSCYILMEDDVLPVENEYYVFNVRERVEDGSYTASGINTAVLLNDSDLKNTSDKGGTDISGKDNVSQESNMAKIKVRLETSDIYQKYQEAFEHQVLYDPNK